MQATILSDFIISYAFQTAKPRYLDKEQESIPFGGNLNEIAYMICRRECADTVVHKIARFLNISSTANIYFVAAKRSVIIKR